MQVSSGAFDYITAIRNAVKDVASKGLQVIRYDSGRRDQLDVAIRRTVLTGVSQTTGNLQLARTDEMECDLVAVSAHIGARNVGEGPANHESWQGKIYSRSGADTEYPNFYQVTGFGTIEGLGGVNCRHSFYPFFEGISEAVYSQAELDSYANKTVVYNGKEMSVYEATQYQRGIERKIRYWKRQAGALEASGLKDPDTLDDLAKANGKVKEWQGEMRKFVKETELIRQPEREKIAPFVSDESVDRDLRLAQQGKLFDLQSKETEVVFSKQLDYSSQFGNEHLRANEILFEQDEKVHTWNSHEEDREWFTENQDLVLKAITEPLFVDNFPRKAGRHGVNIAHIVYIGEKDLPFLNVVINFKNKKAKIWTMFRANKLYVAK